MRKAINYFLVGPMGSGKSTVGRKLAQALEYDFFDSDREIETRTGVTIAHIFDIEGEAGFRRRETDMLAALVQKKHIVLATGGGSILAEANRAMLKQHGTVIYLKASVDTILRRTSADRARPLLQTEDRRGRLEQLMQQRAPLYEEVADYVVETDHQSVGSVAGRILKDLCGE